MLLFEQSRLKYHRVATMRGLLIGVDKAKRQRACQHGTVKHEDVELVHEGGKAYATGLIRCGCEACAFDAWFDAEQNRREITVAMVECQQRGGALAFATWSVSHEAGALLVDTSAVLKAARRAVLKSDWWQARCAEFDIYTLARPEETFGGNGWHPHDHDGLFMFNPPMRRRTVKRCPSCQSERLVMGGNHAACTACNWQGRNRAGSVFGALQRHRKPVEVVELVELVELDPEALAALEAGLRARYVAELVERLYGESVDELRARDPAKLAALNEHAFNLRTGDSGMADYIAKTGHEAFNPVNRKHGVDSEMALGAHIKNPRHGGLTPFQLQDAAGGDEDAVNRLGELMHSPDRDYIIARAGALAVEHWRFVFGRHRLHWGKRKVEGRWIGLKERLNFKAAYAAYEAANEAERAKLAKPERVSFCWMTEQVWQDRVCGDKTGRDVRAELLAVIRTGDAFKLAVWLTDRGIDARIPQAAYEYTMQRDEAPAPAAPPGVPALRLVQQPLITSPPVYA